MKSRIKQYSAIILVLTLLFTVVYSVSADTVGNSGSNSAEITEDNSGLSETDPMPIAEEPSALPDASASAEPLTSAEPSESAEPSSSVEPQASEAPFPDMYYEITNDSVDETTHIYTADVMIDTNGNYLATGTFGFTFDPSLQPVFTINTDLFSEFQTLSQTGADYYVVQWYWEKSSSVIRGKVKLGTITISNVKLDKTDPANVIPEGWHTRTLRQYDWTKSAEYSDPMYTNTADGVCLNREIYNDETRWYQGMNFNDLTPEQALMNPDNFTWDDIGFKFSSNYSLPERTERIVEGRITSYNKNNNIDVILYKKGDTTKTSVGSCTIETADYTANSSGIPGDSIYGSYKITLDTTVEAGKYIFEAKKDVHLTYSKEIEITDDNGVVESFELYCGDIFGSLDSEGKPKGDERIKLIDRDKLLRYLNKQIVPTDDFGVRCDLNGDGKVTVHDLNILIRYYNKSYIEFPIKNVITAKRFSM